MADRDRALTATFVRLVDTLVADYDPIELAQQLVEAGVELLRADAAALLLADAHAELQVFASTSEELRLLELLQIQSAAGPCLQAFHTGEPVLVGDLAEVTAWPVFRRHALARGFRGVCAVPLRLRDDRIGALNLFTIGPAVLTDEDLRVGQALADFATIGILHARILADSLVVNEQLTIALNSRVIIEQAKGMLAERANIDMDTAFHTLRRYARGGNHRLAELAQAVVERGVDLDAVLAQRDTRR
ncbi:GAF and ANTAR domain-containing protein [Nocardia otitidiscaviarum]|uniref:GAF and ANTAR domain-containing protein n=1 Tax=Nocardia otitidiscaviarum TaxID=1823 RepID=UPI001895DD01|nr:GAF and ANTAR domain-containing protein [Nocardia otitidiscaviarum]MBF6132515.1 GAF and ANTAR domain-containing protein [Nocardia otitidiscaviarum]